MNDGNTNLNQSLENTSNNNSDIIDFDYSEFYCYKEKFELTKKDTFFAIFALVFSIFISLFGFFGGFALGYTVSVVLSFLVFAFYLTNKKSLNLFSLFCAVSVLLNSLVFITTTKIRRCVSLAVC